MEKNVLTNTKIRIIVIAIAILLISVLGLTYAFFTVNVYGNEEASSVDIIAADLKITYTDGPGINVSNVSPGWSTTKTFSVRNTGNSTIYYDIKMYDVYGTFVKDELVYTLTSTNGGGTKTQTIMPNNDGLIKAKISINANVTQTYTMTITFKETSSRQDYNQGATYNGIIQIISPYTYTTAGVASNIKLVDRIMLDNTEAYPINASSKYVTNNAGLDFSKPSDYGYNGYYTFEDVVDFTSSSNKYLATAIDYDNTSGLFKLTGATSGQTYSTAAIGKYTCNHNSSATCYVNPQEAYKILDVSGSTAIKVLRYMAKPDRSSWNGLGLYQTSTNTVGNQPTYFFRGHVVNNYVSFAGDKWRIVRINEDGSIKLIREANYVAKAFNTTNSDPMYVGYMYGTSSDPYVNSEPSNAKTQLEAYYDSKLASRVSLLAPIEFCNDRSIGSTNGARIYYGAYTRLYTNKAPIFTCPNETRDLFTMSTSSRGNKTLTKSVGLLTYDEAAYAGLVHTQSSPSYLNINTSWRTSTPYYFYSSKAYVFCGLAGGFSGGYVVTNSYGLRPVISLKADVTVSSGSGTTNDPYLITQ